MLVAQTEYQHAYSKNAREKFSQAPADCSTCLCQLAGSYGIEMCECYVRPQAKPV